MRSGSARQRLRARLIRCGRHLRRGRKVLAYPHRRALRGEPNEGLRLLRSEDELRLQERPQGRPCGTWCEAKCRFGSQHGEGIALSVFKGRPGRTRAAIVTNRSGSILYIPSVEVSILVRQAIGSGCKTVAVSGLIEQPRFHSPGRRLFSNLAGSSGFPSVVRRRMRRYCSTPGSQKCLFPFHFVAPLSCCDVQLRAFYDATTALHLCKFPRLP